MAERSVFATVNVPAPPATVIDLEPLGIRLTVPLPAFIVPANATSLAVIVIAELVEDIAVDTALVTLPEPSVVMVTPVVPVTLALRVTAPFEPDDVTRDNAFPDRTLEAVSVPLAARLKVPLLDVIAPDVPSVAEAPVVVNEKLPPTVDVPSVSAPALVTSAVPGLPVLTVNTVAAAV